jgi:cystathionine gamma-synthase
VVLFCLPHRGSKIKTTWPRFYEVIYDTESQKIGGESWSTFGDGLSTRHAEFCEKLLYHMCSESQNESLRSDGIVANISNIPTPEWATESMDHQV